MDQKDQTAVEVLTVSKGWKEVLVNKDKKENVEDQDPQDHRLALEWIQ